MAKTGIEVIAEWITRGYITTEQSREQEKKYLSFIEQAKSGILAECNIPHNAPMPTGLFYVWVDIAWDAAQGNESAVAVGGEVKSVSEGDTTITFATNTVSNSAESVARSISSHAAELKRFRRIPW